MSLFIPSYDDIKDLVHEFEEDSLIHENVTNILEILEENKDLSNNLEKIIDIYELKNEIENTDITELEENTIDEFSLESQEFFNELLDVNKEIVYLQEQNNTNLLNVIESFYIFIGLFIGLIVSINFLKVVFSHD